MADTSQMTRLFQNAGQQKQQQAGTGFTNLGKLFQASTGNKLGEEVAGGLQKQVGGIQTQLGKQQEQFQTEADKNKVGTQSDVEKRDATIGRFSPSSTTAGTPLSDKETQEFGRFTAGQYSGPKGLQDTSTLQSQASQLQQQAGNLSPSGTQELLRRSVGGDRYTQGQQRLDSLLMGQGNQAALVGAQRQAGQVGSQIQRANLAASGQAELLKNQAQQFADQTKGLLGQNLQGIEGNVQQQLTSAQAIEKERQNKLQALQSFAANKTAKLDEQGNVLKDQYGNIQYDTAPTRGTTDQVGQLDYLQNLLKGQGVQQGELDQLFGQGNIKTNIDQYNQAKIEAQKQADITKFFEGGALDWDPNYISGDGMGEKISFKTLYDYDPEVNRKYTREQFYNAYGGLSRDTPMNNGVPTYNRTRKTFIADASHGSDAGRRIREAYSGIEAPAKQNLLSKTGLAGQVALGGRQEDLYKNLAAAAQANSQQAENLTEQGVASQTQAANYEALNKLLGNQTSKYTQDQAGKYKAGNLLLNPEQIKKALGY